MFCLWVDVLVFVLEREALLAPIDSATPTSVTCLGCCDSVYTIKQWYWSQRSDQTDRLTHRQITAAVVSGELDRGPLRYADHSGQHWPHREHAKWFWWIEIRKKQQKSGIRYTRCMCEVSCHCKRYVIRCAIEITLSVCLCLLINWRLLQKLFTPPADNELS